MHGRDDANDARGVGWSEGGGTHRICTTEPPPVRSEPRVASFWSAATRALTLAVYVCSHTRTSRMVTTGWSSNRSPRAVSSAFFDSSLRGGGGSAVVAAPDARVALVAAEDCLQPEHTEACSWGCWESWCDAEEL